MHPTKQMILGLLGTLLIGCGSGTPPASEEETSAHSSPLDAAEILTHAEYFVQGPWGDGNEGYAQLQVGFNDKAFAAANPGFDGRERIYANIPGFGTLYLSYFGTTAEGLDAYWAQIPERHSAYRPLSLYGAEFGLDANAGGLPGHVRARRSQFGLDFLDVVPRKVHVPVEIARAFVYKGTAKVEWGEKPVAFAKFHYKLDALAALLREQGLPAMEHREKPYLSGSGGDWDVVEPNTDGTTAAVTSSSSIKEGASLEPLIQVRTVEGWWIEFVVQPVRVETFGSYTSTTGYYGFEGLPEELKWLADPWATQPP